MGNRLILIVDDDEQVQDIASLILTGAGYNTVVAGDGVTALRLYFEQSPDLVLLDLSMPRLDGREVIRELRVHSTVPIVIITGDGTDKTEVEGLRLGADSFLAKPFSPSVLSAHVDAVLRRSVMEPYQSAFRKYSDALLILDLAARQLLVRGLRVKVIPSTLRILGALVQRAGNTVSVLEMARASGADSNDDRDAARLVRWHIMNLRRALGDDPRAPQHIINIRGTGYLYRCL